MPVLRINAPFGAADPVCATACKSVENMLKGPSTGPITIMLHGFRYSPFEEKHDPHAQIFALRPRHEKRTCISWPHHLGFGRATKEEGQCIAFGWHARGTIWQAYKQAIPAADTLAAVITTLHHLAPNRKINVMAHSLGARVLLAALAKLPENALNRIVLMAGAELSSVAQIAMQTPAGKSCEVLNITSRENDLYDLLIETAIAPHRPFSRSLGHGLSPARANWLDLQLDCANTLAALRRQGFPIAPPLRRICHWSTYLRPGMFPLYRQFLHAPDSLSISDLSAACARSQSRRWSRLFTRAPLLSSPKR
ncbi:MULTISPECIES: alpha/beta fold hydrolase [Falsihalocynthiibacter]|uniref:alpha/beta fold hydrolase n=1 Tax=Falsihalocynthiibacter TaxID=2854182 RepID=UPI0030034428